MSNVWFVLFQASLVSAVCLAPFLYHEDYLSKTNKLWNIYSTCLWAGGVLSVGDLVRDPQPKEKLVFSQ